MPPRQKTAAKSWTDAKFIGSFCRLDDLPKRSLLSGRLLPEIAIVGRSNSGKSSFINALFNSKGLAKVSQKPGKTRTINLFEVNDWLSVTDLPGYGYAQVGLSEKKLWQKELLNYLLGRAHLIAVVITVDIRRSLEQEERDLLQLLGTVDGLNDCLIIATKSDKLSLHELQRAQLRFEQELTELAPSVQLRLSLHIVSSKTKDGVKNVRTFLETLKPRVNSKV